MTSDEDSLEQAAAARRERLKALKAAQQLSEIPDQVSAPNSVDNNDDEKSQSNESGKRKKVAGKKNRIDFVLHDPYMARIIDLLGLDLGAIDKKVKLKQGRARVDRQWVSKFITVDWRQAFTDEGHLRVPCFFDMLPKLVNQSDAHSSLWKSYRRVQAAALGLADYNMRHKGNEFDLVKPITAQPALIRSSYVSHANFLAKRKDDPASPVVLFFAVVHYSCDEVTLCCPVESALLPPDITPPLEKARFKRARVIHPEGFQCLTCDRAIRKFL